MARKSLENQPAHWVLAEMGKRVLRPGGRELTLELVDALDITPGDDVVEFAPGTGFTARLALDHEPGSYTGVELDREAANALATELDRPDCEIVVGNAGATTLDSACADVVYGEALLTMQPERGKASIVNEAERLLRPGGTYGIHELGLIPDDIDDESKSRIREDLSHVLKVNARPLTESEWVDHLETAGFEVVWQGRAPMALLDPRRMIDDEGLRRTMGFGFNLLAKPSGRRRVRKMRSVFDQYEQHMNAVAVVAKKR